MHLIVQSKRETDHLVLLDIQWRILFPGAVHASLCDTLSVCWPIDNMEYHVFADWLALVYSVLFSQDQIFCKDVRTLITSLLNLLVYYMFLHLHQTAYLGRITQSKPLPVCQLDFKISLKWSKFCAYPK